MLYVMYMFLFNEAFNGSVFQFYFNEYSEQVGALSMRI